MNLEFKKEKAQPFLSRYAEGDVLVSGTVRAGETVRDALVRLLSEKEEDLKREQAEAQRDHNDPFANLAKGSTLDQIAEAIDAGRQLHEPAQFLLDGYSYTWDGCATWVLDPQSQQIRLIGTSTPRFLSANEMFRRRDKEIDEKRMGDAERERLSKFDLTNARIDYEDYARRGVDLDECDCAFCRGDYEYTIPDDGVLALDDSPFAAPDTIEVGDVVELASGGPAMTVTELLDDDTKLTAVATVIWFNEDDMLVNAKIETAHLVRLT